MKKVLLFLIILMALPVFAKPTLMIATTTSTDNTGLLDYLAKEFKKDSEITLKWVAVGTGRALKMGELCDVDSLLVHAPNAEKKFVESGFGIKRTEIMYNDFVLLGSRDDSAKIKGKNVSEALRLIKGAKATFVSRGDESGTHKKEKLIWSMAGLKQPIKENWYLETGQGMLATLRIAAEKRGYVLADRGTYIKFMSQKQNSEKLKILISGDKTLLNQYSVINIDPKHCKSANVYLAKKWQNWLVSHKAQELIGQFRLLGKILFVPNAK